MRCDHSGVLVVDVACGRDGEVGIGAVRQLRGGREHLEVDSGAIHQSQPRIEFAPSPALIPRWVAVSVFPRPTSMSR